MTRASVDLPEPELADHGHRPAAGHSELDVVKHLDGAAIGGIDVIDAKLDILGGFFLLAQRPHGP